VKFLLYSDLHMRPETLRECEMVHDKIGEIAQDMAVDYLLNGGDTHHHRGSIGTRVLDVLYRKRREWYEAGLKNIDTIGNHDQEDKAGEIHAMKVFEQFDGWKVFDKPTEFEAKGLDRSIFFVPYMLPARMIQVLSGIGKVVKGQKRDIPVSDLVCHADVVGAMMGNFKQTEGVGLEVFERFHNVFSGHYHMRQKVGNVQYIGSPYQQNFGEAGQKKGVLYYNQKADKTMFVEIKGTPRFHTVGIEWEDGRRKIVKPKGMTRNDRIRVRVSGTSEQCNSVQKADLEKRFPCKSMKVEREVRDEVFSRLKVDTDVSDTRTLAREYMEFVNPPLNQKKLMKIFDEVADAAV